MTAPAHQHQHEHQPPDVQPYIHPHPSAPAGVPLSAEQAQLGPTERGTVVLDIGGDIGSLIIMTSSDLAGAEVEISPLGQDHARTHIAIRERIAPGGTRWAGIFPGLNAGTYTVWDVAGNASATVEVIGGQVSQLDWR